MPSLRTAVWFATIALFAGVACRTSPLVGNTATELRTDYADLFRVLGPADLERWVAIRTRLRTGLDQACASAACGGYTDLATVQLTCSASTVRHAVKECAWTLGGSIDAIDGATGVDLGEAHAIGCTVPVHASASAFLDALAGDAPLDAPLPGTGGSFHDALRTCLATDAGNAPASQPGDFVALDGLWPAGTKQGDAWRTATRALEKSFDDICGDTFCEGDYSDISGLRLSCATTREDAFVHTCTWSFAMAMTEVAADGAVTTTTATRACPIQVDAPAISLLAALSGNDPLYATLPGRTTSINDALIGCL